MNNKQYHINFQIFDLSKELSLNDKKIITRLLYGNFHNIVRNIDEYVIGWKYNKSDLAIISSLDNKKKLQLDINQIYYSIYQKHLFNPLYEYSIIYKDNSDSDSILSIEELEIIGNKIKEKIENFLGWKIIIKIN